MTKFIVFEGNDCSGKTTSIKLLSNYLTSIGKSHICIKFPDRNGIHGEKIDRYLKNEIELTNEEAYQMFVENRIPYEQIINDSLSNNVTVICDRYLYSGIVYSYYNKYSNIKLNSEYVDSLIENENYMQIPDLVYLINGYHQRNDNLERYEQPKTIKHIFKLFKQLYKYINVNYKIIDNSKSIEETKSQLINDYINLIL